MELIIAIIQIVGAVINIILFIMLINAVLSITTIRDYLKDMQGRQQFYIQKLLHALEQLHEDIVQTPAQ